MPERLSSLEHGSQPVVWPEEFPSPRQCSLCKWPTKFRGYGFHLQAEKNRPGHYIGQLDQGGPAEQGGLVSGWRIVAVNDVIVLNDEHQSVVLDLLGFLGYSFFVLFNRLSPKFNNREIVLGC